MLSYCLRCGEKTDSKNLRVVKTKNRRVMVSSNCALCGSKGSRFIKRQKSCETIGSLAKSK